MSSNSSEEDFPPDGSLATSSATSHATSVASVPTWLPYGLSVEAAQVVANLSNYLALGCLCFEDFFNDSPGDEHEPGVWKEVMTVPVLPLDGATATHLDQLHRHGWVRLQMTRSSRSSQWLIYRIYLLFKDVGLGAIDRRNKKLTSAIEGILPQLDTSHDTWMGAFSAEQQRQPFDMWATRDEDDPSLFYLFNRLPSPSPRLSDIKDKYEREALEDLLDTSPLGLKTELYPYQRRSAGAMLHRELFANIELDPRVEKRTAADGSDVYYSPRSFEFFKSPQRIESVRGGILAESMGYGKTLICLALILTSMKFVARAPPQYAAVPVRAAVGSLADMATSTILQKSIPWKVEFERLSAAGMEFQGCVDRVRKELPSYYIPREVIRRNRTTTQPPALRMILASTTLIVVPANLVKQWASEINKHIEEGALKVLIMDDRKKPLPPPQELAGYDVILFARNRFDMEGNDGSDTAGRRLPSVTIDPVCRCPYIGATRTRDCSCLSSDMLYDSPLKFVHFKRLIVDEGHFFSSSNSTTVFVASKLVTADHRWSVSGTPAKDLLGVEVHMSAASEEHEHNRLAILEQRRRFSSKEDKSGAVHSIGTLATSFLKAAPWSEVSFKDHVFRHEGRRHTYSGFSACLRKTLESIVVKTRPEDVERDIQLPPMHQDIVRLEPSFYDKLSANLFALVLTANAITSERTDVDYLFHKNSQKALYQLISNLRQSAFFWTGFSESDVQASIKNSTGYLAKENGCTPEDRQLLEDTLRCTEAVLGSKGWGCMSRSHELGVFVEDWPSESSEHWAFDDTRPMLTGLTQLLEAQDFVNARLDQDAGDGLGGAGIKFKAKAKAAENESKESPKKKTKDQSILAKSGVPNSSLDGEPLRRLSSASAPARKKVTSRLSTDSPWAKTRIVGTASAKLSYLISQVMKFYRDEKILIFYQGDNTAWYIAQALEVLGVNHEIYAKSLQQRLKSVARFDQGEDVRVLLMDVGQAAFGLHLSSASRIYFVNPVCRPNVEAQAVKRAHRIGQKREVFVETLVLKGSIEEKMLERSKRMTPDEHREASHLEDDGGVREIIQSARLLPLTDDEKSGASGQMARLESPEQLWARPDHVQALSARKRKREPILEDVTDHAVVARIIQEHEQPDVVIKRRKSEAVDGTRPTYQPEEQRPTYQQEEQTPTSSKWASSLNSSAQQHLTLPSMSKHGQLSNI